MQFVKPLVCGNAGAPHGGMPFVTDAMQLAGFLFGGWLLFRFTDWIYQRSTNGPDGPEPMASRDPDALLRVDTGHERAIVADHGIHGPRDAAHLPGRRTRRQEDVRHAQESAPPRVPG